MSAYKQKDKKSTILLPLISVLAILALLAAGYFFWSSFAKAPADKQIQQISTPTPVPTTTEETANWKTYTSNNWSLKYPSSWQPEPDENSILLLKNTDLGKILIWEGEPVDGTDNPAIRFETETIKIDGANATLQKYYVNNVLKQKNYFLKIASKKLAIQLMPNPGIDFNVLDQILSTFKFTNLETKTACGGWDTSGEVICECSGKLIKNNCPVGSVCDGSSYVCDGVCGKCCYKGEAENPKYPKC